MQGWVKVHRKYQESRYANNLEITGLFVHLLLLANHKKSYTYDGTEINAGQFMTSHLKLGSEFNVCRQKIRRMLQKLENEQQIKQQTSNKNTIITITNWSKYQVDEQQSKHQLNNKRTSNEHQMNTNKNVKNVKNERNKNICVFDINLIYSEYPKKQGKALGIKKLSKTIKTQEQFDKILNAVKVYSNHCKQNNIEAKYIKQFSTWVNQECWNDTYEEKEYKTTLKEWEIYD